MNLDNPQKPNEHTELYVGLQKSEVKVDSCRSNNLFVSQSVCEQEYIAI